MSYKYSPEQRAEIGRLTGLKAAVDVARLSCRKTTNTQAEWVVSRLQLAYEVAYNKLSECLRAQENIKRDAAPITLRPPRASILGKLVYTGDPKTVRAGTGLWYSERYRANRAFQYFRQCWKLWAQSVKDQEELEDNTAISGEMIVSMRSGVNWHFFLLVCCGLMFCLHIPVQQRIDRLVTALDQCWPTAAVVLRTDVQRVG